MLHESVLTNLRALQKEVGDNARSHGFRDEGDNIRIGIKASSFQARALAELETGYRNYAANRLMLIVGEISEAHEELRKGRAIDETHYPTKGHDLSLSAVGEGIYKPEGVPSELADAFIRILDTADEFGIDLAAIVNEKMTYNASRPHMHGKKF